MIFSQSSGLSYNNLVYNNTCYLNDYGMRLVGAQNISVYRNRFEENNNYGLELITNTISASINCTIYSNSFILNNLGGTSQAFDEGKGNKWYNDVTSTGNYWSDYTGSGPYHIAGSTASDLFPLLIPPI
jgi:parallel beta-helix repeat protein